MAKSIQAIDDKTKEIVAEFIIGEYPDDSGNIWYAEILDYIACTEQLTGWLGEEIDRSSGLYIESAKEMAEDYFFDRYYETCSFKNVND